MYHDLHCWLVAKELFTAKLYLRYVKESKSENVGRWDFFTFTEMFYLQFRNPGNDTIAFMG